MQVTKEKWQDWEKALREEVPRNYGKQQVC